MQLLIRTDANRYERHMPDGSRQIFAKPDGAVSYPRRIFMTEWRDPTGNAVTIHYDTQFPTRISEIEDALGYRTSLDYNEPGDPYKISEVKEPFEFGTRSVKLTYSEGKLTTIEDTIGIQSIFGYASGSDTINALTTPYGTTTFTSNESGTTRWVEVTGPNGIEKERVEYRDNAPGLGASETIVPNTDGINNANLNVANTFYWDKKAMAEAPGDYTKAKITHWLLNADGSPSGIVSSEKRPLENRVWYVYADQPDPQHVGPERAARQDRARAGDATTQVDGKQIQRPG